MVLTSQWTTPHREVHFAFLKEVILKYIQPIALNERSVNVNESMKAIGEKSGGSFIAGSVVYNLSRSRYGKRLVQSTTRDYGNARWLGRANGKLGSILNMQGFLPYLQVDPSERENLQNKVREAQIQLEVAKDGLAKYRERESELRADEFSIGKQLVCSISLAKTANIDFQLAWPPREEGQYCQGTTKESSHPCQNL